jgi:phospholipid/cholesterol/gamma-HCH transport system permease protein
LATRIGGLGASRGEAIRQGFRRPFERALWVEQLEHVGVQSLTITNVTLLFTGMVLAVQTSYSLSFYGGQSFVGNLLGLSIIRELGPVLTALMVAGRVGAGITAEIGSMTVTEQVDALRVLAASPVKKLVVPRVGALVIALPLLTVLADIVGLFGGMVMAVTEVGQSRAYFISHVLLALTIEDVMSGVGKTFLLRILHRDHRVLQRLKASGGADGVGKATTNTVVSASIAIIISDFFLTKIFLLF